MTVHNLPINLFIVLISFGLCSNSHVEPIKSNLNLSLPNDVNSVLAANVLLNANKYALGTWYPNKYGNDTEKYLNFHGNGELNIRLPAMEAFGLAVSIHTKLYDEKVINKTINQAIDVTKKLVSSLAYKHRANLINGWGNAWESSLWTYFAGFAAWLLWDKFDDINDRNHIEKMIEYESNRFVNYTVPYYQNKDGKIVTPGDTKTEENSWNSLILQLSTSMMPSHPNSKLWMKKNLELLISASACPHDLLNNTIINGKAVKYWLNGTNIFNNGTLVNHNRIHPDYMTNLSQNIGAPLTYTLAGMETPQVAFWNADLVYSALVDLEFKSPPFNKPGGTIYIRDSSGHVTSDIYYPQGDDWGMGKRIHFAFIDTQISLLTQHGNKFKSEEWAHVHIDAVYKMQQRFHDGRSYTGSTEDTYPGREEYFTSQASLNYLTRWLTHNYKVHVTNKEYD